MAFVLLEAGFLTVTVRHTAVKDGLFFYYRRIPQDLRSHYGGKVYVRQSLKTRDPKVAAKAVAARVAADDALWASLRSPEGQSLNLTTKEARDGAQALLSFLALSPGQGSREAAHVVDTLDRYFSGRYGTDYDKARNDEIFAQAVPPESFYTAVEKEAVRLVMAPLDQKRVLLSDALACYFKQHDRGEEKHFRQENERAIGHVTKAVGDLPLPAYRREHANAVRDHLLSLGLKTASARRDLNRIKAVFNVGLKEFDLRTLANPFERLPIAREEHDAEQRVSFTPEELKAIVAACRAKDDDVRHIVSLLADTGARLGELVGLRIEDMALTEHVPHVHIREHLKLGRRLKNKGSVRKVPLLGEALWAAQRAVEACGTLKAGWLFPRYTADGAIKATHASNTINKWLRGVTGTDKTAHSFRHTMRDRMRHAGLPEDIQDLIGGWGSRSVGQGYGSEGYRLEQLRDWLANIVG